MSCMLRMSATLLNEYGMVWYVRLATHMSVIECGYKYVLSKNT